MTALKERAYAVDAVFEALARGQGTAATVSSAFSQTEEEFPVRGADMTAPIRANHAEGTARVSAGQPAHSEEQARAAATALLGRTRSTVARICRRRDRSVYSFSDGAGLSVASRKQGGRLLA